MTSSDDFPLFEPGLRYPEDGTGAYQDLEGEVIKVSGPMVTVATPKGVFVGVSNKPPRAPGGRAEIRIYSCGGGFYPDFLILSWSTGDGP